MKNVTIYHNSRCTKSSLTLELLKDNGITPNIVFYLENPPSKDDLRDIVKKMNVSARKIMRTGEAEYKEQNLADESLSDDDLFDTIIACPKLLERPIVVCGDKAAIGRPPENVLKIL